MNQYRMVHTACQPNAFKLELIGCVPDNSASNFFKTKEEAEEAAKKRGGEIVEYAIPFLFR